MPISFLIEKELPRESKQWRVSYAAWEMYLVTFGRAANIRLEISDKVCMVTIVVLTPDKLLDSLFK